MVVAAKYELMFVKCIEQWRVSGESRSNAHTDESLPGQMLLEDSQ